MQDQDKIFGLIAQAEDIQKHAVALQRAAQEAIKTLPDASRTAIRDAAKEFITAVVALGLFTSARVAEQVRAGIQSLSRGQRAAGPCRACAGR